MIKPEKVGKLGKLYNGDCLEVLKEMEDNSVTGICADPPAGISFMNKNWDSNKGDRDKWIAWMTEVMTESFRVLKPGGMAFIWAIPRTSHWTATAIENAGFIIREKFYHIFGSGFPKSANISKQIDRKLGKERKVVSVKKTKSGGMANVNKVNKEQGFRPNNYNEHGNIFEITEPNSEQAKQFEGYGTATKPAAEEWVIAMKPNEGSFADNALKWGVAGINVDGCRIKHNEKCKMMQKQTDKKSMTGGGKVGQAGRHCDVLELKPQGRWPANLILQHHPECKLVGEKKVKGIKGGSQGSGKRDKGWAMKARKEVIDIDYCDKDGNETIEEYDCHLSCPIRIMNEQVGIKKSGTNCVRTKEGFFLEHGGMGKDGDVQITYGDSGYVSRYFKNLSPEIPLFFYSSKASTSERNHGCENIKERKVETMGKYNNPSEGRTADKNGGPKNNHHPTVKSLSLIKYLCSFLKMPQNTVILDMFAGSGTLGVACEQLGINYILVEREQEYCDIIRARVAAANKPVQKQKIVEKQQSTNGLFDLSKINLEIKQEEN